VNTSDYWGVMFDTTETIKNRFDAEGIGLPFPQRDIHIVSGSVA
jgi:small conductance mechanosensitive channel